jgi:hypothetical protein
MANWKAERDLTKPACEAPESILPIGGYAAVFNQRLERLQRRAAKKSRKLGSFAPETTQNNERLSFALRRGPRHSEGLPVELRHRGSTLQPPMAGPAQYSMASEPATPMNLDVGRASFLDPTTPAYPTAQADEPGAMLSLGASELWVTADGTQPSDSSTQQRGKKEAPSWKKAALETIRTALSGFYSSRDPRQPIQSAQEFDGLVRELTKQSAELIHKGSSLRSASLGEFTEEDRRRVLGAVRDYMKVRFPAQRTQVTQS